MEDTWSAGKRPTSSGDTGLGDELGSAGHRRWHSRVPPAVMTAGWVAAAALTLAAPFGALNTVTRDGAGGGHQVVGSVDGWGRDQPAGAVFSGGVAFGAALWLCAAGLLAAGVLGWLASRTTSATAVSSVQRRAVFAVVAAPATLVGVVACMALSARSFVDWFSATTSGPSRGYDAGFGLGLWFSVAAAAVAVAAAYLWLRTVDIDVSRTADATADSLPVE